MLLERSDILKLAVGTVAVFIVVFVPGLLSNFLAIGADEPGGPVAM